MKKRDWMFAAAMIVLAAAIWLFGQSEHKKASALKIMAGGKNFGIYDLKEDREIKIYEHNICTIKDGIVSMTWADCPDQICVKTKEISKVGETIICLPHKVVLEIISEDPLETTDEISS